MDRNWDDEFFRLVGSDVPLEGADLENLAEASELDAEEAYMALLQRREEMIYVQHQVMVNAFQSKTFLFSATGLVLLAGVALACAWSIWYWCR